MQRILTIDLRFHAFKIQLTQELKLKDYSRRTEFVNWFVIQKQENAHLKDKINLSSLVLMALLTSKIVVFGAQKIHE